MHAAPAAEVHTGGDPTDEQNETQASLRLRCRSRPSRSRSTWTTSGAACPAARLPQRAAKPTCRDAVIAVAQMVHRLAADLERLQLGPSRLICAPAFPQSPRNASRESVGLSHS